MYDPTEPSHTVEEIVEMPDGNRVSVRTSVQHGAVVAGSFSCAPGYDLKPSDVAGLPFDKLGKAAIRSAPKEASK